MAYTLKCRKCKNSIAHGNRFNGLCNSCHYLKLASYAQAYGGGIKKPPLFTSQYQGSWIPPYQGNWIIPDNDASLGLERTNDVKFEILAIIRSVRVLIRWNFDGKTEIWYYYETVTFELLEKMYNMAGFGSAQLIWEPTAGVYKLTCDINWHNPLQKGLAEFLKAKIPHHHRSWTPATKTWAFEEQYFHSVKGFIELAWPDNNFIYTKEQSDEFMRQQQQAEQNYYQQTVHDVNRYITQFLNILIKHCIISNGSKFDFTKDKDYEDAKHLYKKACFKLHPDRNPAYAEDMSKLNEAWSIIKTEKEAKNAVS